MSHSKHYMSLAAILAAVIFVSPAAQAASVRADTGKTFAKESSKATAQSIVADRDDFDDDDDDYRPGRRHHGDD